jgi:ABC-type glycerol-3-phosphate transport system substrate-binding protein
LSETLIENRAKLIDLKGKTMLKLSRILLTGLLFNLLLGPVASAQDAQPSGKILVWMQIANQDQIEATVLPGFYEAYPGIEIEFVNYSPSEVAQNLALAIQGGTGAPDVALMETNQVPRVVDLGGLVDLTDYIGEDAADFNPSALAAGLKDGRYYAVPWDVGPVVLYYRRDIFEAAGLPSDPEEVDALVATWDSFFQVCQTIKSETGLSCFAQNRAGNYGDIWTSILWSQGIGWLDAEGRLSINTPAHVEALEILGRFWEADLVSDDLEWTDGWYATLNEPALEGGTVAPIATLPIAGWMGGFLKNWAAPDSSGLWGVVRFPAVTEDGVRSASQGGSSYTIPAQSANVEAAWAFIEYINSTESQVALFEYGDIFPARFSAYESPVFSEGDPYFAGQAVREIYAEAARNMPVANIVNVYNTVIGSNTDVAIQRFATGEVSAQAALDEAAELIRLETGLQ